MSEQRIDGGRRRRVNPWRIAGILLILAALGLAAFNLYSERHAGVEAELVVNQLAASIGAGALDEAGEGVERAVVSADTPMPVAEIDGNLYVGVLRIPALGLELPVMSEWSYAGLRVAPCRYAGSVYAGNMAIAAHNYSTHFGRLKTLSYGDEVSFIDVRGNVFVYEVSSIETVDPYEVAAITESSWDLTLLTCTLGGANRVAIRCTEVLM